MSERETQNKGGRPTKYKTEYNKQVYHLALLGATEAQIAEALDVSLDTITEWKAKKTGGFSASVRAGKLHADSKVANGLYKRATGFTYDEVTFEKIDGKVALDAILTSDVKTEAYKKKVVTKLVPPDVGAATLWLKNRQKELWRDKMPDELDRLTDEQLEIIFERLKASAKNGQE